MNQESKRPITVEDLLRLKRAERPPAEFWHQFDRELRAKQLAALVDKTPWWRTAFAGLARYSLPLGATAALAITYVVTRDEPSPPSSIGDATVALTPEPVAAPVVLESGVRVAEIAAKAEVFETGALIADAEQVLAPARESSVFLALESGADASATRLDGDISPSARHIAANLAAAQAAAPQGTHGLLAARASFIDRPATARTVEPLAQVSTPAERSRARFATAMVTAFGADSRGRATSANVARRISDERVYDDEAIRRVGATGNSVAWRF